MINDNVLILIIMINNNRDYTVIALFQTIVIVYYMSIYTSLYIVQCSQSHIVSTSILYSLSHSCMSHLVVKIYEFISFKPVCINDILAVIILSFSNLFSLQIQYS